MRLLDNLNVATMHTVGNTNQTAQKKGSVCHPNTSARSVLSLLPPLRLLRNRDSNSQWSGSHHTPYMWFENNVLGQENLPWCRPLAYAQFSSVQSNGTENKKILVVFMSTKIRPPPLCIFIWASHIYNTQGMHVYISTRYMSHAYMYVLCSLRQ